MLECDHDYFCRRAGEERAAAQRADCPVAQSRHLELAERYDDMASASTGEVVELKRSSAT